MADSLVTPLEMFYHWEKETPERVFLRQPKNLVWTEYTWRDVADQVRRIAHFLNEKGYEKGSRIGIWSANSKDWPIVDLAIQLSGHVSVPIYPGQDTESACYVFGHSETRLVFVGGIDQAASIGNALVPGMEVVGMLGCDVSCATTLDYIVQNCPRFDESPIPKGDDLLTLPYTSGTTGNPKGVMHTHATAAFVAPDLVKAFGLDAPGSRLFSFLPMSHMAERSVIEMTAFYANAPISFSEGQTSFADEIRSVQPTFFFAVPRLWMKFKEGIDAKIPPDQQAALTDQQKREIARGLGLGEARMILTGSAPLSRDVQDWFLSMGIVLRDGYGATENFVHGTAWLKDDNPMSGCVGQVMTPNVQVRVNDDDEIQFKSRGLMKGYYLDPEKTAEAFDDGWYRTGDSGRFDKEGNLWITGRIIEVFKTSKGKFIVPTRIESKFGRSDYLAQFCVFGLGKPQPMIFVTLSESGMSLDRTKLRTKLINFLEEINSELPAYERLSKLFVTPAWTIENSLLTPTLKVKRRQIESIYVEQVEQCSSEDEVVFLV